MTDDLRLAELLGALSLVTDLGMGHPPEQALRACVVATELARALDVPEPDVSDVYYTTLLRYVGCTAYAAEEAAMFGGDDIAVRSGGAKVDFDRPREALSFFLFELGKDASALGKARIAAVAVSRGKRVDRELKTANCEVAAKMAGRLRLDPDVQRGLFEVFERWDGKGTPNRKKGEAIALAARFAVVAHHAVIFDRIAGADVAVEMARRRSGGWFDPEVAEGFARHGTELLETLSEVDVWDLVREREPQPYRRIAESRLDEVARAFGDVTDLKSPYLRGHAAGVAALAEAAGAELGLPDADLTTVRRAAWYHDLGRAGVPNGIWDKEGPLGSSEWDSVRLHPYHTERILSRSPALAPLAPIAGLHHERLDGTGYHRGVSAALIPLPARILAAADAYHALSEDRPHRRALVADEAARTLEEMMADGRLDPDAGGAVLAATGRPRPRRSAWPAGLTEREVEVLRLLARGRSTKDIAEALFVSGSTVHTHTVHIYEKIEVSTRAAAALFAMEHGLLQA